MTEPGYQGPNISTAIMLVGISQKIVTQGTAPYINHLERLKEEGYQKVFLAGRDTSIPITRQVAALAPKMGLAKTWEKSFKAKDALGEIRDHLLIEMEISSARL